MLKPTAVSKFSVFATKDLALPDPNLAFASCECASCGTQFTVQASLDEPFCVQCGSDDTKVESNTTVTASVHKLVPEQDPSYVTCATCATHLVISSAIEQSGVLFCPCCGNSAVHASDEGVTFGPEHEGRTEVHMHSGENIDPQEPLDKCAKPEDRVSNPAAAKRDHENQEVANWGHLEDIDEDDDYDLDDMDDDDMDLVDTIGEDDDAHWCDDDYPDASNQLAASEEDERDSSGAVSVFHDDFGKHSVRQA